MNILFYFDLGFDPSIGGIERVTCSLSKGLKEKGHNIFFTTFKPYDKVTDFERQNHIKKFILPNELNFSSEENIETLSQIIKSEKIDILISQSTINRKTSKLPALVKKRTNIKLIYAIHTSPDFLALRYIYKGFPILPCKRNFTELFIKNPLQFLAERLLRFYFEKKKGFLFLRESRSSDALVVLSPRYIPILYKMNKRIKSNSNIFAIPNINTYPQTSLNLEKKENLIIFVGRLSIEKHPEKAMWIWKQIQDLFPDWSFKMIGDGDEIIKKDLETLKDKWCLQRFTFEGSQKPKSYYEKAKILFLLSDYEGFPMVLTEAMQYGVIPMSFKSSEGIYDIITDGENGEIIENFKLADFANRAKALMNNPEKLKLEAETAYRSSERFTLARIIKKWEVILQKILNER